MVVSEQQTAPYDFQKLKTVDDCRRVMMRAREQKREDLYSLAFKRQCEIAGSERDDPSDPLVRRFFETLAAYEQLLSEKNHSNTVAARTRQKIANKGVHQSLIEWTRNKIETNGFQLLLAAGMPEYTAEYIVVEFGGRFPHDVVELAMERLRRHEVAAPEKRAE
jgi:hypothetical protein